MERRGSFCFIGRTKRADDYVAVCHPATVGEHGEVPLSHELLFAEHGVDFQSYESFSNNQRRILVGANCRDLDPDRLSVDESVATQNGSHYFAFRAFVNHDSVHKMSFQVSAYVFLAGCKVLSLTLIQKGVDLLSVALVVKENKRDSRNTPKPRLIVLKRTFWGCGILQDKTWISLVLTAENVRKYVEPSENWRTVP